MIPNKDILVVDDEEDILELVGYHLRQEGFKPVFATTGEEALQKMQKKKPMLVVLDLMLPGIQGIEVAKIMKAREELSDIPIIMLTAKSDEIDMVVGLEIGADDYVTKPFSPKVLMARIKAVLRRRLKREIDEDDQVIRIGEMSIYPHQYEVFVGGKRIQLTTTEFKILMCLAKRPNWVFSRSHIVDLVHGEDYAITERTVDVFIASLRKKLDSAATLIETVRGVGYKLKKT